MAIKKVFFVGLVAYLTLLTVGCAVSTDYSDGDNPMPDTWAIEMPNHSDQCISIDGEYRTLGLGRLKAKEGLVQTRLDVALGHAFPTSNMPENVHFSVNEEADALIYQFGLPVDRSFSLSTRCKDGWYVSEKKQKNIYIGEGGTLDYSIRKIGIGKSVDGGLIVHLLLEAQSSSYLTLKARDTSEIWSKYEELDNEN